MATDQEGLAALFVIMLIIGFMAYTQAPKHWQTTTGFLIIVFGWVPAGLLLITLLKEPLLLIPSVFICAALMARRA